MQKEILKCYLLTTIIEAQGVGKKLITYAIDNLQVTKVDVNEQNIQAVGFYKHIGFNIYKRSDLDGEGKAYPILHMQL